MSLRAESFIAVANEAELASMLARCSADGRPVLVTGGLDDPARLPGEEDHLAIGLGRLNEIIAFEPDDLTVTVQAGLTCSALERAIGKKKQRLALETAFPDESSLGAVVAENRNGFIAALYGELPEQVLGLRTITGDGRLLRSGGRVVKNVTGYDTRKLHCGASGTLGVITEISFRLRPRPIAEAFWSIDVERSALAATVAKLRGLRQKLSGLVLELRDGRLEIHLRIEGARASLRALEDDLLEAKLEAHEIEKNEAQELWARLRDFPGPRRPALLLRHLPAQLGALLDHDFGARDLVSDLMSSRSLIAALEDESAGALLELTRGIELARQLDALAATLGDPDDARLRRQRFGEVGPGEARLEAELKKIHDPAGILMHGRLMQGRP